MIHKSVLGISHKIFILITSLKINFWSLDLEYRLFFKHRIFQRSIHLGTFANPFIPIASRDWNSLFSHPSFLWHITFQSFKTCIHMHYINSTLTQFLKFLSILLLLFTIQEGVVDRLLLIPPA